MSDLTDNSAMLPTPECRQHPTQWGTTGLIMLVATLCVIGLFWTTIRSMVEVWGSSRTFAHGSLILPAACYLVWCHRQNWMSLVPHPSGWGVTGLVLAGTGWLIATRLNYLALQQVAVVALLPALAWAILGTEVVRAISWPLGFLVFMLPYGNSLEPWLQDFTAGFILVALQLTGIPSVYEHYRITIPSGIWEIAPDCGGLRYLLPGLALGCAFAIMIYREPVRRFTFLAVCALVLMLANGLRAYGIIVGDHIGIAEGTDHRVFSYTIYGLTLILLYWVGMKWAEPGVISYSRDLSPPVWHPHVIHSTVLTAIAAVLLLAMGPFSLWLAGV